MTNMFELAWNDLSPDIKAEFGEDYFRKGLHNALYKEQPCREMLASTP